jgi:RNA polymerase sigma-70 factor (ECF subfamily)
VDHDLLDDLAVRAGTGDREAFQELMRATMSEVRLFIAVRAHSLELVEEVLQATYVACFESLGRYEPRGTLLPWLRGIAYNRLRRELDSRSRHAHADALEHALADEAARALQEPAEVDEAILAALRRCLERLTPRARDLLERRHAHGASLEELAVQFARSRAGIASMLKRIRLAVRTCMEPATSGTRP